MVVLQARATIEREAAVSDAVAKATAATKAECDELSKAAVAQAAQAAKDATTAALQVTPALQFVSPSRERFHSDLVVVSPFIHSFIHSFIH